MDFEKIAAEFADGLSAGPIPEPAAEKVERAGRILASNGWNPNVAGEADFTAASLALARCSLDGLPGGANPPGEPRLDGDVSPHLQPARRRGT